MKILVKKQDILDQIAAGLKEYDEKYNKAVEVYLDKLQNYIEYLKKYSAETNKKELKYPPPMPSWMRNNFVRIETALKAHIGDKVSMEDSEYNDVISGIEHMRGTISANLASLVSYG